MIAVQNGADEPRRAGYDATGVVARLIATAFVDMPVVSWLVPVADDRTQVMTRYVRILVEHAMAHGRVDTNLDRSAVAVWLPAGDPTVPTVVDYEQRRAEACGEYVDRFRQLDDVMHDHHPDSPPHEHLAFLAVRAGQRCRGLGGHLLAYRHRELDQLGRPAYLEATTMRAARLYLHHGYKHIGAPFAPGSCNASMWPMWRDPQPVDSGPVDSEPGA